MAVEADVELIHERVVRHYRGATPGEVEQAYTAESAKAARSGYLPVQHQWSSDSQALLLAVTYAQSVPAAAPPLPPGLTRGDYSAERYESPEAAADSFEPYEARSEVDAYAPFAPRESSAPVDDDNDDVDSTRAGFYKRRFDSQEHDHAQDYGQHGEPAFEPLASESAMAASEAEVDSPDADEDQPDGYAQATFGAVGSDETEAEPSEKDAVAEGPSAPSSAEEWPSVDLIDSTATRDLAAASAYEVRVGLESEAFADRVGADEPETLQPEAAVEPEPEPEMALETEMEPVAEPGAEDAPVATVDAVEPTAAEPAPETASAKAEPAGQAEPQGKSAIGRQSALTIQTMDLHCAGEPLRIIRSGFPDVPNLPVLERRQWVMENADRVRKAVIQEPRGHRDMYGAILLPPHGENVDICVLFMHNEGYSTMCGHGIIAITTGLIEEGLFPANEPVTTIRYEVPAGVVAANAATTKMADGSWAVQGVRFTNVPSYVAAQSLSVRPDGVELFGTAAAYGAISVDLAFGGAYYGVVNAADLGLRVVPEQAEALRAAGAAVTDVLRRDYTPAHPTASDLSFVYGTIIVDLDPRSSPDGRATDAHMRNATIFADAEFDRSPCGSGTSAILAQLHARGRIKVGQEIVNAGITGEHFLGRVESETSLGPYPAISTSIAGTAYATGYSTFVVDDRDPLGEGFLLG